MKTLITFLIACSFALTASAEQAQENPKKKSGQKAPPAQKQQHAPPQQQHQQHPEMQQHAPPQQQHPQAQQHAPPQQQHPQPHQAQPGMPHEHAQKQPHPPKQQQAITNNNVEGAHKNHAVDANNAHIKNANTYKHNRGLESTQPNQRAAVESAKQHQFQSNQQAQQAKNNPAVTRPSKETVQRVKAQHINFHAQPNTNVASVQFNQGYRVRGAENWQGAHYQAFRSYHPEWHDHDWWHSHYHSIVLIGGGWYFWNAGYWYPAWGYDPGVAYYPYDGPIYTGSAARRFDTVVADVQAILQEQGYYRGEVDGLVGPLTQDALAAYQESQGLIATAAIDQPTLESLGLS